MNLKAAELGSRGSSAYEDDAADRRTACGHGRRDSSGATVTTVAETPTAEPVTAAAYWRRRAGHLETHNRSHLLHICHILGFITWISYLEKVMTSVPHITFRVQDEC